MPEPRPRFGLMSIVRWLQISEEASVLERFKRLTKVGFAGIVLAIVFAGVGMKVTSNHRFCSTCHFMRPYVASWSTSKHNKVECIECHFPPSIKGELWRKFQASVQVVKYVTKQYGTKPWTQIEDASCLRSGCHVREQLPKKQVRPDVAFDHLPHLSGFRRVTRLRCTSCHSQIVQGNHMVATLSTCYLCHFKHTPEGSRLRNCTTCHTLPIRNTRGAQGYDHQMANERRVSCLSCHGDVIQGTGEVPRERCLDCHMEPARLARYNDVEFMHRNHVTDHKVECLRCHQEIKHGLQTVQASTGSTLNCTSCHPGQHSETQQLYGGVIPGETSTQADPMADARVACQGCHLEHKQMPGGSDVYKAGVSGCANCHGEQYGRLLTMNRNAINRLVAQVRPGLNQARRLANSTGSLEQRVQALALLDSAERKVREVERGGGVHNPSLSQRLLRSAAQEVNHAMQAVGASHRISIAPLPSSKSMPAACLKCHAAGFPLGSQAIYGVSFDHQRHLGAGLDCATCHVVTNPGGQGHGQVRLSRDDCLACHKRMMVNSPHPFNWRTRHGTASERSYNCSICHVKSECSSCHKLPMPHPSGWRGVHGKIATQRAGVCSNCHARRQCQQCHASHPPASHAQAGFRTTGHGKTTNKASCVACHGNNACTTCHGGIALPHTDDFKMGGHGKVVQANPLSCTKCHAVPKTCMGCHDGLPPGSHADKSWGKTHGSQPNKTLCALCHGKSGCATCHAKLTKSPHPDDFAMEHKAVASFQRNAKCFLCHKIDYCQQCHEKASLK